MPGVEGLDLRLDAQRRHHAAHRAQHAGRVGHDVVGLGEVHRAAIERADLGQALAHMLHAVGGAAHVGALLVERQRRFRRTEHHVAAHAGGEVQHHVDIGVADALGHFAVEMDVAARLAGLGVAHMAMDDRGAGLGGVDRRFGDLLGRARHVRAAILRAAGTGHGTGNEDLAVHRKRHRFLLPIETGCQHRATCRKLFCVLRRCHDQKRKAQYLSRRA